MSKSDTDLLSPGEVAFMARKSGRTIARWADEKKLGPVTKTDGGQRRFQREFVEAFIASLNDDSAA